MDEQQQSNQNLEKDLNELERKLNDLKTRYDQYFLGLDKKQPQKMHDEVTKIVRRYAGVPIQNTGFKFRYQTLVARYNSYQAHWNRILREIEEGTYKRDVFKAKLHEDEREASSAKPAPGKEPAAKDKAAGKPAAKGGAAQDPMGMIYQQYIDARAKTKESVQGLSRDVVETQLKKQMAMIKEKFNCKKVTFKVVVEEGKAKIKALPKND